MTNGGGGPAAAGEEVTPQESTGTTPKKVLVERPRSPMADLIVPIPIKPSPAQTITLRDLAEMDKENRWLPKDDPVKVAKSKSVLPPPVPGGPEAEVKTTSVTISLNTSSGTSKSVLRALNGLAKLLKVEATHSITFCFLFVRKIIDLPTSMTPHQEIIFSFVPPSNSLMSISDP